MCVRIVQNEGCFLKNGGCDVLNRYGWNVDVLRQSVSLVEKIDLKKCEDALDLLAGQSWMTHEELEDSDYESEFDLIVTLLPVYQEPDVFNRNGQAMILFHAIWYDCSEFGMKKGTELEGSLCAVKLTADQLRELKKDSDFARLFTKAKRRGISPEPRVITASPEKLEEIIFGEVSKAFCKGSESAEQTFCAGILTEIFGEL